MLDILSLNFLDSHFTLAAAAANIAGSTQTGADLAKQFAEDFWSNVFKMGIFGRVAQASMYIAGAGIIYKGYYIATGFKPTRRNVVNFKNFSMIENSKIIRLIQPCNNI